MAAPSFRPAELMDGIISSCYDGRKERGASKRRIPGRNTMNLGRLLKQRAAEGRPVRVGVIGAGKFSSLFLAQARTTPGLHLLRLADLSVERAEKALAATGWDLKTQTANSLDDALKTGRTFVTDDAAKLIAANGLEVVIDITGSPAAAIRHTLAAIALGRHVVNGTDRESVGE